MCKKLSAKYYQENRERLKKNLVKGIKIFPKNKKEKEENMVVSTAKSLRKCKKYTG